MTEWKSEADGKGVVVETIEMIIVVHHLSLLKEGEVAETIKMIVVVDHLSLLKEGNVAMGAAAFQR